MREAVSHVFDRKCPSKICNYIFIGADLENNLHRGKVFQNTTYWPKRLGPKRGVHSVLKGDLTHQGVFDSSGYCQLFRCSRAWALLDHKGKDAHVDGSLDGRKTSRLY